MAAEALIRRNAQGWSAEFPTLDVGPVVTVQTLLWVARIVNRQLAEIVKDAGLGVRGDFETLALLHHAETQSLAAVEIADSLMISTSAVTGRLDRLENAGLIRRRPDAVDRRSIKITITDAGRDLVRRIFATSHAAQVGVLEPLSASEQAGLATMLTALLGAVEARD